MTSTNIITLENFAETLPKWHPDEQNQLYAVVDMGSNGIRFSITSLAPPRARLLTPIYVARAGISLFDALTPSGSGSLIFTPETISEVSTTLANFNNLANLHDVPRSHIMIFATEAMRRASNAAQMLEAIARATNGLGVHILEPAVETLFGAVMGSRSGLLDVPGGAMFLDLGGGSVQMTWVDTSLDSYEVKAAKAGKSMPFGAAKLSRILEQNDETVHATEIGNLRSLMQKAYNDLSETFPKLRAIRSAHERGEDASVNVYMCGGGFRGYGSMLMHHDDTTPYPIPSIGTYTVDGVAFKRTAELRAANKNYDGKVFGMSRRRRHQFDAISTVVESFIATVPNVRQVTFCKGSNRDGALMMLLPRHIRESNPLDSLAVGDSNVKELSRVVIDKLKESIPEGVDLTSIPTVLSSGLQTLFAQLIWSRAGYEADTNASYALHSSVSRDSDAPGLTHTARAALGLTLGARWGSAFCPADAQLAKGLRNILKRQHADAAFWAQYIGSVCRILVTVWPIRPHDHEKFKSSISFKSSIRQKNGKKDRIQLDVIFAPESLQGIESSSLADLVPSTLKNGDGKPQKKVAVQIFSSSTSS